MEDKLKKLISERDKVRSREKQLTQEIKAERSKVAAEKLKTQASSGVSQEAYRTLRRENKRLRGLFSLLQKQTTTYRDLAEILGVSTSRAREVVEHEKRILLRKCHMNDSQKKLLGLELTVDALELSARTTNCLKCANVIHIGQVLNRNRADLMELSNLGASSINEIERNLEKRGLRLRLDY